MLDCKFEICPETSGTLFRQQGNGPQMRLVPAAGSGFGRVRQQFFDAFSVILVRRENTECEVVTRRQFNLLDSALICSVILRFSGCKPFYFLWILPSESSV